MTTVNCQKGLTLIELLIAMTIMGIIAMAAMPLISTSLESHQQGMAWSQLHQEGLLIMQRLTNGVRRCTFLLIPNAHTPVRDILAFSGTINDDGDAYFDDPLFPRIDEDTHDDMQANAVSGIQTIDDDGDGLADEENEKDDDEDGSDHEEILDGVDQDGDGNIDEDLDKDANDDGQSGIKGMDDDADGNVDEAENEDDDEDGTKNEDPLNPLVYTYDNGTDTLTESNPDSGTSVDLSTRVTLFQTTYEAPDATHGPRIQIELTLTGDDGKTVEFDEYAYPRNVLQKTGKRVR